MVGAMPGKPWCRKAHFNLTWYRRDHCEHPAWRQPAADCAVSSLAGNTATMHSITAWTGSRHGHRRAEKRCAMRRRRCFESSSRMTAWRQYVPLLGQLAFAIRSRIGWTAAGFMARFDHEGLADLVQPGCRSWRYDSVVCFVLGVLRGLLHRPVRAGLAPVAGAVLAASR